MATATTSTTRLNVDDTILLALVRAGEMNADAVAAEPGQLKIGKMFLRQILDSLQNKGVVIRATERYPQATVDAQAYVDAPADTIAVDKGGVVRNVDGSEFEMTLVSKLDYQRQVDKTVQGKPMRYFPEQRPDGSYRIYMWPVPIAADWPSIVYPRERRLKDVDLGNVTVDLDARWDEGVGLKLAAEFARHYGRVARQRALVQDFKEAMGEAMDNETERGDATLIASPTGWER